MRLDRAALRAALKADLAVSVPAARAAQFSQAVRDEIDRGLLADLSKGALVEDHLPVSKVAPIRRSSHHGWVPRQNSWRLTRVTALAATFALVGGVAWLAMQGPVKPSGSLARGTNATPQELPSWAVLPPRTAQADERKREMPGAVAEAGRADGATEPLVTRDAAKALAWAKRGVLAVRITTNSPRRDRERLDALTQAATRASRWTLSTSAPSGFAAIPARPWPIDVTLADGNDSWPASAKHPDTATLANFGLTIRPTTDAVDAARNTLERSLAGIVVFERVDALAPFAERPQAEPTPDSAMDVLWWKKPASQWSPRLRIPVVLEFGTSPSAPAK